MKNKQIEIIKKDIIICENTGLCYNMTIYKEGKNTVVDVIGRAENSNFSFEFKNKNDLIKLLARVIIDKEQLERKLSYLINDFD